MDCGMVTPLFSDLLHLLAGVGCAWVGGEFFVRGLVGLARWTRVPAGLVGVTVAAFATSSPEIAVAVKAATKGVPQISLGDLVGSNVANVALILALALLIAPIKASFGEVRRDFMLACAVPVILGALAIDGHLSRLDGMIMMATFVAWLVTVVIEAMSRRTAGDGGGEPVRSGRIALQCAIGLVLLIAAGHFIVIGAKGIALAAGLSEFVVGATIVAVATGTPELATAIISKLKGHDEIGLGNILGSNIFNGLLIVALLALIQPFDLSFSAVALTLGAGLVTTLVCLPSGGLIRRGQGIVLLLMYAGYVAVLLHQGPE